MQGKYLKRTLYREVLDCLQNFPAVAILGPRQCGKSTLAHAIISEIEQGVYLDLEKPSDLNKLGEPELFFDMHKEKLICLDEIQRLPEIFKILRSIIDEKERNGQFLILGSASRDLIRQSSETLAGRIAYLELTPFLFSEINTENTGGVGWFNKYWFRGGFPRSYLARSDKSSLRWRENFIRTFLERDIPQLGFHIAAETLRRLWMMCAHNHGQLLNASRLGESMGVSHTTLRSYIDLLSQTFMVRVLPPYEANVKKRLVKSPKIYIRDTGILHALLGIGSIDDLMGHPVFGSSWEGFVIENIIGALPGWHAGFYRTSAGAELDLVLERGTKRIGIKCKASPSPRTTKGFWNSLDDLGISQAWIIAPVKEASPIKENVIVAPLNIFLEKVDNN
ncbi:MAG: ATP-binding protein [Thermodesulfobacteriota bacterium]|nr:ATP-binding protein [Thermodesulfobacteriota bacterium]